MIGRYAGVGLVMSLVALPSPGADSVDWPANYESTLAAHVQELVPSGSQSSTSPVFSAFDSRMETCLVGLLEVLRNYPQPGTMVFFR